MIRNVRGRFLIPVVLALALCLPVPAVAQETKGETQVLPVEDLMREHGVLSRILLIYDLTAGQIEEGREISPAALKSAAEIVRDFIEGYHEKLEEEYIFTRMEKAGKLMDLTQVLRNQHDGGRKLTAYIIQNAAIDTPEGKQALLSRIKQFTRMYRPHKAREDTVLFPAFHALVPPKEYAALGEKFEARETRLFGEGGFEKIVDRVAGLEKQLGIYDLDQFTPK